jgi:hypothetical protein
MFININRLKNSTQREQNSNDLNNSKHLRYGLNQKKGTVRPVIYWGTHHKTGTYIAQKTFALLCARQKWCCVFHPTRYIYIYVCIYIYINIFICFHPTRWRHICIYRNMRKCIYISIYIYVITQGRNGAVFFILQGIYMYVYIFIYVYT